MTATRAELERFVELEPTIEVWFHGSHGEQTHAPITLHRDGTWTMFEPDAIGTVGNVELRGTFGEITP